MVNYADWGKKVALMTPKDYIVPNSGEVFYSDDSGEYSTSTKAAANYFQISQSSLETMITKLKVLVGEVAVIQIYSSTEDKVVPVNVLTTKQLSLLAEHLWQNPPNSEVYVAVCNFIKCFSNAPEIKTDLATTCLDKGRSLIASIEDSKEAFSLANQYIEFIGNPALTEDLSKAIFLLAQEALIHFFYLRSTMLLTAAIKAIETNIDPVTSNLAKVGSSPTEKHSLTIPQKQKLILLQTTQYHNLGQFLKFPGYLKEASDRDKNMVNNVQRNLANGTVYIAKS